jgi:glutaredoxin
MKNDWKKYIVVFFITAALFAIAGGLSNFFTDKKVEEMRTIQNKLATDILSSEAQFSLLSELSCEQDDGNENLSSELNDLADKINYSEANLKGNSDVIELKRYYSILEIKDYLLTKKINQKCGNKFMPLLYFYTTANNCTECTKQGFVLTELRAKYPNLRVYSFDYNLDLSALRALIKVYKVDDTKLPTIIINDKKVTGFKSIDEIEKIEPTIKKLLPQKKDTSSKQKTGDTTISE